MKTEKEIFVEEFMEQIGYYMYEHVDSYDYSLGMERMDDKDIKAIAEDFFDEVFLTNTELRKLKLKKINKET